MYGVVPKSGGAACLLDSVSFQSSQLHSVLHVSTPLVVTLATCTVCNRLCSVNVCATLRCCGPSLYSHHTGWIRTANNMVCAKCEEAETKNRKSSTLAVTDVWKPSGTGSDQRNERKIGSNKLLEAKRRYASASPAAGTALRKGQGNLTATDVGSKRRGAGSAGAAMSSSTLPTTSTSTSSAKDDQRFGKCKVCKVTVAKEGAKYCQSEHLDH